MAGYFELVDAPDGGYRVRLLDGAWSLMSISVTFPTKRAAVAGVAIAAASIVLPTVRCRLIAIPSFLTAEGKVMLARHGYRRINLMLPISAIGGGSARFPRRARP